MRFSFILALILLTLPAAAQEVPQSKIQIDLSFAPVVKAAAPAVVNIYTKQVVQQASPLFADPFFGQMFGGMQMRPRVENSLGSGVIVRGDGLVVTNAHVAKNADEIRVSLSDRREFPAKMVLVDEKTDLALLKIDGGGEVFPFLKFTDSEKLEVGDLVLAIGNPFGVGQTVTSGIVSGLARTNIGNGLGYYIQTDAAINPGNSGGALVNLNGEVVGINTMIFSKTGGYMGIGFAVPSNLVKLTIAAHESGGAVKRPFFGAALQNVTAEIAESLGMKRTSGALVQRVFDDTPAAKAGLKRGDVIVSADGRDVSDGQTLRYIMATQQIGGTVTLSVLRQGANIDLSLPVEAAPKSDIETVTLTGKHPLNGSVVADITPMLLDESENELPDSGVVIMKVQGLAARFGLRPGDIVVSINGQKISDAAHLQKLLESKPPRGWSIVAVRGNQTLTLVVR